jgi:hypothetical protein
MAQQQPDLFAPFKEQLRKLAEEAGPIECLSNELYRFKGVLIDAAYMCDELAFMQVSGYHEFTIKAIETAVRGALSILRMRYKTEAFSLIPPGLLYLLYESNGQPDIAAVSPIAILFVRPTSNFLTQWSTASRLILPLGDLGSDMFETINRKDVYMLRITATGGRGALSFYAFGFAKDLRDVANAPFAILYRRDSIDGMFIGLTMHDFIGTKTTTLPVYLDWEIENLRDFLAEAITNAKLDMWIYIEAGSNQLTLQAYTPPQVKKQEIKK